MVRISSSASRLRCRIAVLQIQLEAYRTIYTIRQESLGNSSKKRWWKRKWPSEDRRVQFGLYDQLVVELRNEAKNAFENFMRMPTEMYDELVTRISQRITRETTTFQRPKSPGMKVATTLRHLASGTRYRSMRFGWRVPHNTISRIVKEVRLL